MNFKINESATKLRGGYYTDPQIASFLTRWVMETRPRNLLEPSCGDGVFIDALVNLRPRYKLSFHGIEIESSEARKSRSRAKTSKRIDLTVSNTDFLNWSLRHFPSGPHFDAALGNPPFIRYQYLEPEAQAQSEQIMAHFNLPFTKHTNAWVPFVVASLALLKPGGRFAMVVPSEILHVLHARSAREFLARQCSRILIVDPEELWFDNALQGAVLLLAEKKNTPKDRTQGIAIIPVTNRSFLDGDPRACFHNAHFVNGKTIAGKWTRALLNDKERDLLDKAHALEQVSSFADVADVDVGIVTGANKFFLVPDSVVEQYHLQKWAHPMFGRSEHVHGVIYDQAAHNANKHAELPANFLWFRDESPEQLPKAVQEYICQGVEAGLPKRYKCRIREPWYSVPSVYATSVGMLKRSHQYPRLILNKVKAFTTDTAYRIRTHGLSDQQLVFCFVNSLTALSAEIEGRHYGGGVLELVPSEIEKLLLPRPRGLRASLRRLDNAITHDTPPHDLFPQQDDQVLRHVGFSSAECHTLFEGWNRLRKRRQRVSQESAA